MIDMGPHYQLDLFFFLFYSITLLMFMADWATLSNCY